MNQSTPTCAGLGYANNTIFKKSISMQQVENGYTINFSLPTRYETHVAKTNEEIMEIVKNFLEAK